MMRWDKALAQYDRVKILPFLNGRIKVGYPPSVGSVDVNYGCGPLLRESDLIGWAIASGRNERTFALKGLANQQISACPCGQRLIIDTVIVDLSDGLKIDEFGPSWVNHRFFSPDGLRLFVGNSVEIHCFDPAGFAWKTSGLFEGDLASVTWQDGLVHCAGPMGWVDPNRNFSLYLDPTTGEVVGGDDEARKVYVKDRAPS
jgi:hypothetical protein